ERLLPVPAVQTERLAGGCLDPSIRWGQPQHLSLVGSHRGPNPGQRPVAELRERLEHPAAGAFGRRAREPAHAQVDPVGDALTHGAPVHARSSFRTWLDRTSTANA